MRNKPSQCSVFYVGVRLSLGLSLRWRGDDQHQRKCDQGMSVVFGNAYHRDKEDPRLRAQAGCRPRFGWTRRAVCMRADSRAHLEQPVSLDRSRCDIGGRFPSGRARCFVAREASCSRSWTAHPRGKMGCCLVFVCSCVHRWFVSRSQRASAHGTADAGGSGPNARLGLRVQSRMPSGEAYGLSVQGSPSAERRRAREREACSRTAVRNRLCCEGVRGGAFVQGDSAARKAEGDSGR